jgi:hypothetical protein
MGRHRRPDAGPTDTRIPDGDEVPQAGWPRWVDLLPTRELPLIDAAPARRAGPPYVTAQERRRWLSWWSR